MLKIEYFPVLNNFVSKLGSALVFQNSVFQGQVMFYQ